MMSSGLAGAAHAMDGQKCALPALPVTALASDRPVVLADSGQASMEALPRTSHDNQPDAEASAVLPRDVEPGVESKRAGRPVEKREAEGEPGSPASSAQQQPAPPLRSGDDRMNAPALEHMKAAGAIVTSLGKAHGAHVVLSQHGDEFLFLNVAPDGQAVVGGLQTDVAAQEFLKIVRDHVTDLGEAHGFHGYLLRNGKQFQALYATPDGARLIPGVMWDASGKNMTREQIAPIVGEASSSATAAAPPAKFANKTALQVVEQTAFGAEGQAGAPRLWMFVDPMCSYSVQALQAVQSFVASGRVQLAVIPVSVLDYEDKGKSTTAALAMLSQPADRMIGAWASGDVNGAPPGEADARLRTNMAAAETIGLRGTPTIIWKKADGSEGRMDGLPGDWTAIIGSMAGGDYARAVR